MKHLLFLDDESFQINMIQGYYDRCPLHKITTAEFIQSPLEAAERCRAGGVDYLILDMTLGNITGYDVISFVSRVDNPPIIWAYTAANKVNDIRQAKIARYIKKSQGLNYLFSELEVDILKHHPQLETERQMEA